MEWQGSVTSVTGTLHPLPQTGCAALHTILFLLVVGSRHEPVSITEHISVYDKYIKIDFNSLNY